MANSSERRQLRWQRTAEAVYRYGPGLYRFLGAMDADPGGDERRPGDECWVDTFVRVFRDTEAYLSARERAVWVSQSAAMVCAARGVVIDKAALLDAMRSAEAEAEGGDAPRTKPQISSAEAESGETGAGTPPSLAGAAAVKALPDQLWNQLHTQLLAAEASRDAQSRRTGSLWTRYAALATALFGLAGVAYGVVELRAANHQAIHPAQVNSSLVAKLPPPRSNLPTTTLAQFRVPANFTLPSLAHAVIASNTLYVANLTTGTQGATNIEVRSLSFSDSGKTWSQAVQRVGQIPLSQPSPPTASGGKPFSLASWQVVVSGKWLVAVVSWTDAKTSDPGLVQFYQLNLNTLKARLITEVKPNTGQNTVYSTAAGEGRVVIQPGVEEGTGSAATLIGLPIQVYQIEASGSSAFAKVPTEIPGTFGVMSDPTVLSSGVIFQGLEGQATQVTAGDATWYELSWGGSLARLQGPPVDNQQHWALESAVGQLWWVETTPAPNAPPSQTGPNRQVLMGRLGPIGSVTDTPAQTLNGPVDTLSVSGTHLIWVQTDNHVTQLVVSEVTQ